MNTELTKTELTRILSALCGKERKPANATVARKAISKRALELGTTTCDIYYAARPFLDGKLTAERFVEKAMKLNGQDPTKPKTESRRTKKLLVLDMLRRSEGASGQEIMDATGWQKHSVRGFIATCRAKGGIDITPEKTGDRGRVYRISDNQAEQT